MELNRKKLCQITQNLKLNEQWAHQIASWMKINIHNTQQNFNIKLIIYFTL